MKMIYNKIGEIQKNLMGETIKDYSLDSLIPLIFKETTSKDLMFYFNWIENACVLNIIDCSKENEELHVRYYHHFDDITPEIHEIIESRLLCNTFLLTGPSVKLASSDKEEKHDEKPIQESNIVPPRAIRAAMDTITGRGEKVTRKAVEKELQLNKMSTDNRRQCIAYLKDMEE